MKASCQVSAELAAGHAHRAHRRDHVAPRADDAAARARGADDHRQRRRGRWRWWRRLWAAAARAAATFSCSWCRRISAQRSSDQIAFDLRRQLSGIPGVIVRANASGGNNQINRLMSGGHEQRRRPHGGRNPRRRSRGRRAASRRMCRTCCRPRPASPTRGLRRDEARPELAVQVDRPKAALFGLNTTQVANTIRTNVAGTIAAQFRQGGYEYPDHRPPAGRKIASRCRDVNDVMVNTASGVCAARQERDDDSVAARAEPDRPQEPGAHHAW